MTASRYIATLAAAASLMLAAWFAVPAAAGGELTTIGVRNGAAETSFALSRTEVRPGLALIQYANTGEDPHDVRLKRRGADTVLELPVTLPGAVNSFPLVRLKRHSRYILWCSLDGHREAGMEANLRVKRRR